MAGRKKQKEFDWVKAFFQKSGYPQMLQTYRNSIQIALQRELEAWADKICGPKGNPKGMLRRNGYYPRGLLTVAGWVELKVPRFRGGVVPQPPIFKPYQRHSAEVMIFWITLFSLNLSCRNISKVLETALGTSVSFQTVYRWVKKAHSFADKAVTGDICEEYYALIFDGVYGRIRDSEKPGKGVLLASMGVTADGDTTLLGITPAQTESPDTWSEHIQSLINRGLASESVKIVTTDNHVAFSKTIPKFFPSAAHQPCIFHTSMDVAAKVSADKRYKVKSHLSRLWSAKTPWGYFMALAKINSNPVFNKRALRCLHRHAENAMAYFEVPEKLVKKVRTTNQIELLFRSFRSRTRKLRGWQTYESLKGMLILTADSKGILNKYT